MDTPTPETTDDADALGRPASACSADDGAPHLNAPGEIATPLTSIREMETYEIPLGGGGHLIEERHTISDVLRYLIEYSDYEEVMTTLEVMRR